MTSSRSRALEIWRVAAVGVLALVVVGGLLYPPLGLVAAVMMLVLLSVGLFRGRYWCGHLCPRGSFLDLLLRRISPGRPVPPFLRTMWLRLTVLALLMSALAWSLANLPLEMSPDMPGGFYGLVGAIFVRLCLITTLGAIFLGLVSKERAWCGVCPMGTMQNLVDRAASGQGRGRIVTDPEVCRDCGVCEVACPMDIPIRAHLEHGEIADPDCLRCAACADVCPTTALSVARKT